MPTTMMSRHSTQLDFGPAADKVNEKPARSVGRSATLSKQQWAPSLAQDQAST